MRPTWGAARGAVCLSCLLRQREEGLLGSRGIFQMTPDFAIYKIKSMSPEKTLGLLWKYVKSEAVKKTLAIPWLSFMVQISISKTSRHALILDEQSCNTVAIHEPHVNPCTVVPGPFINKRCVTLLEILNKPSSFSKHAHTLFVGWTKKRESKCAGTGVD